jgi:phosphoglycerate dehydrogenase-like enzyme
MDTELRKGQWMMWNRRLQSFNLKGKTLGLLGFGRIGQAVAHPAAAFGMNIQFHDVVSTAGAFRAVGLEELLATSDYLSLHLPLTPTTRGMFNEAMFRRMKPGSIFINTARGEIVEERALVAALDSGQLRGAGLDVFEKEPLPPDNLLVKRRDVVLTPHVASGTADGLHTKAAQYLENIRRVLAGQTPIDCLPARNR